MGLNEADLHALARLLSGFGVWLSVAEQGAPAQPMAGTPDAAAQPPSASMPLADGRMLHIAGPASTAPAAPIHTPSPLQERRAGAEVADMRFRLLAEHSIDMIVAVDADLAIRYASPATARLLGWAPAALHGHTLAELLTHDDRAAFIARHFTRAAQRGQSVPDLFRALHQDGSTRWVEARVARLPPGNGLGDYLVTLRDADQRRRYEESLDKAKPSSRPWPAPTR